jgi:hypothetical protein
MKLSKTSNLILLPRMLRLRDAPTYLGMDRNRFNAEVRPSLTEIPMGEQGIAFDRFELDDWVDEYISAHGRQASSKGVNSWQGRKPQVSSNDPAYGTSTNVSTEGAFAKALEQVSLKKQNGFSHD